MSAHCRYISGLGRARRLKFPSERADEDRMFRAHREWVAAERSYGLRPPAFDGSACAGDYRPAGTRRDLPRFPKSITGQEAS